MPLPSDRVTRDWLHGHLAIDPYRRVRFIRQRQGYDGQDCEICSARNECRRTWDRLCSKTVLVSEITRVILLTRPFPCGQRACEDEELMEHPGANEAGGDAYDDSLANALLSALTAKETGE
jgi:hypothetical protein